MANRSASQEKTAWGLLLLRFLVDWVFLSEGVQKFLFPAAPGAGRFEKIGIPAPRIALLGAGALSLDGRRRLAK